MDCIDLKTLSLYQDGSLDEARSEQIREHLLACEECAEQLRTLGRTGLYLRIELGSHKNTDCPDEEAIGAYLCGDVSSDDRTRIEAHLLSCPKCLHEVAQLSDADSTGIDESVPVPDEEAIERFKAIAPREAEAASARHPWRVVLRWGLPAAAAASVLIALSVGSMWPTRPVESAKSLAKGPVYKGAPVQVASIAGSVASRNVGSEGTESSPAVEDVSLASDVSALQPDTTDLARFAREVGLVLREVERISKRPAFEDLELVQDDIANSGLVHAVASLKETVGDSQGRKFLVDCEYVLMKLVQVERDRFDRDLSSLVGEIKRLNLTETARLMELERGRSRWLAGL